MRLSDIKLYFIGNHGDEALHFSLDTDKIHMNLMAHSIQIEWRPLQQILSIFHNSLLYTSEEPRHLIK